MASIFLSAAQRSALFAGVLMPLAFTGVGRAAASPACTVQVAAGQSIQAAIDGARRAAPQSVSVRGSIGKTC